MDFFVKLPSDRTTLSSHLAFDGDGNDPGSLNTFRLPAADNPGRKDILFDSGHAVFLGDPVFHAGDTGKLRQDLEHCNIEGIIRDTDGFYYLLVIYHRTRKLIISSGAFSILPVFYSFGRDVVSVSSSLTLLLSDDRERSWTPDGQYYLEKALFNFPLFNRTPLKEISLLPSNSFIEYSNSKLHVKKHTNIYDFFTMSPEPRRRVREEISDLFIEKARDFIPESPFAVAMTGGLDSRTVAAVSSSRAGFSAGYTYGQRQDPDMKVASAIAGYLKLNFIPVILDEEYARQHFWNYGLSFLTRSHGMGNISRAHYSYITENCLKPYRYLLSGNFGSEILRSARIAGVVTSGALFKVFSFSGGEDLTRELRSEAALQYLNPSVIDENLAGIVEEAGDYLEMMPTGLTANQRFYTYVFEEVFRKYFGPEIVSQSPFINHRAPFLSFSFIGRILKTGFAGANSDFLETNPLKRIHGQVLHASIMQKTNPGLLDFRLDRGYRPKELLTGRGKMKIVAAYLKKKYSGKSVDTSPVHLTLSIAGNAGHFPDIKPHDSMFDSDFVSRMRAGEWISDQVNFINIMSAIIYRNILEGRPV